MKARQLLAWGNYPYYPQRVDAIHWRDEAAAQLALLTQQSATTLPFGNGRSYGDSCLAASDRVLALRGLNRMISADWQSGIVRAEAGVTLAELFPIIIPRGWFTIRRDV